MHCICPWSARVCMIRTLLFSSENALEISQMGRGKSLSSSPKKVCEPWIPCRERIFFFFVEKVNCVCYCVVFCSDYEEDDRDESESIDNVDILSSLLIPPLFNQEVSFDWRKKRTFSRPPFQSEAKCESFDMKMIIFILMQIELIFTRRVLYLPSFWKWEVLALAKGLFQCPYVTGTKTFSKILY